MDLEDAAALGVCARGEKQRLEGQHERIWLVAAGRWCLAMRRSQKERHGSKHVQGRSASESGHAVSTRDRRARVEHYSASRGGIACHAVRGEGSASGGSFLCVCAAAAASAAIGKARLVASSVSRCCRFCSRTKFDLLSSSCSYKKFSYASIKRLRLCESPRYT